MAGNQKLSLMEFTAAAGRMPAVVCLGHVGVREFLQALAAQFDGGRGLARNLSSSELRRAVPRYQYAVFNDDESIIFNVRPDTTGAKPVTVAFFGSDGPEQLA